MCTVTETCFPNCLQHSEFGRGTEPYTCPGCVTTTQMLRDRRLARERQLETIQLLLYEPEKCVCLFVCLLVFPGGLSQWQEFVCLVQPPHPQPTRVNLLWPERAGGQTV